MKAIGRLMGLLITLIIPLFVAAEKIKLDHAVKKGLVHVDIKSLGSYQGPVIEMNVKNLSGGTLELTLPSGTKLDSQENSEQDLVVTKSADFTLAPHGTGKSTVFTMCCQAHNGSPGADHVYKFAQAPDSTIIKLAQFIEKNNYQNYTAQSAMWCLSDGNCLESITGEDVNMVNATRELMSKLTGKKVLPFFIEYDHTPGAAFTGRPTKMSGMYEFKTEGEAQVAFGIYNEKGEEVRVAFKERYVGEGTHKFKFKFEAKNLPQGKYYARLSLDGKISKETEFVM